MSLTTQYLGLAEQLLDQAQARPDEQLRLTNAAQAAHSLAVLARDEDAVASGYLLKAAALIEPALTLPIPAASVEGARVYADMAFTYAAGRRQAVSH